MEVKKKESFKEKQLKSFRMNYTAVYKMECCICSDQFEEEFECHHYEDPEEAEKKFSETLYKEGWRESTSKVYGHIGIHCPECHKNRNNEKHFE